MRKLLFLVLALVAIAAAFSVLGFAQEDYSAGRLFGIGAEVTAPIRSPVDPAWPNMFPATGLSTRLWLADLFGIDVNFWVFPGFPSFAIRTLFKFFNTSIVDIYTGLGMAFFNGATPFQLVSGMEVSISRNLALNFEVGVFGFGATSGGVSAGLGAHFYF
ncbi:MAG: hypothetical protein NUW06_01785 [Candidatus Acetothermia bacterium]|jgi:hypothetical protein|nr:hypothetical protein [Candidatus Acetothermia bacterium]MDH7504698.1 hypothetical protein [Candidatus Acetothermia bacterium]